MPTPIIYVTHYVREAMAEVNDMLVDVLWWTEHVTPESHELIVVYWCPEDEEHLIEEVKARAPKATQFLRNTRPGPCHCQPSMRNCVVTDARRRGPDQLLILIHNDARPTPGWFGAIVADVETAERTAGKNNAVVIPRYGHYVIRDPAPGATREYPGLWKWLNERRTTLTKDRLREWCDLHQIPMDGDNIRSTPMGVSQGEAFMMFAAHAGTFDRFGLCDETMLNWGYDDDDWALRAMAAGVRNFKSIGAFVEHVIGLAFYHPSGAVKKDGHGVNNGKIFISRWGEKPGDVWDKAWTGKLKYPGPEIYYDLREVAAQPAPSRKQPSSPSPRPRLLKRFMENKAPPPKVVKALIEHLSPVESMIDVGSGEHGPVGQHWWQQQSGVSLNCLDVYAVRDMPPEWKVHIMDMRLMFEKFGASSFDVIQAFDVIEHLTKPDGETWLQRAQEMACKAVLIFTPNGFIDSPAAVDSENPYQKHKCGWEREEFERVGFEVENWGPGYLFALWVRS